MKYLGEWDDTTCSVLLSIIISKLWWRGSCSIFCLLVWEDGWMSVDEIQGKWGEREREGTCESDAKRMKWNRKQSRWRGGGGEAERSPHQSKAALACLPSPWQGSRQDTVYICVCVHVWVTASLLHFPWPSIILMPQHTGGISQSQLIPSTYTMTHL